MFLLNVVEGWMLMEKLPFPLYYLDFVTDSLTLP